MLAIARAGAAAGCNEALFTLGDKPELRYARGARGAGARWATRPRSTTSRAMCALVLRETGLLPHVNPGVMTREEIAAPARGVGVSQGIMLESTSERLCETGGVHYGSPDKHPAVRLETIAAGRRAGSAVHHRHPDRHRRDARGAASRRCSRSATCTQRYGHIQEVIVQNFRAKPGTRMAPAPTSRTCDDLLWTIAVARLILGPDDEHPGAAQSVAGRLPAR